MQKEIDTVLARISELLSTSLRGRILRDGFRVAIVGRPNAGKSSLFNALLAHERAIVTEVAGTTRDVLEEKIEWEGLTVVLSDTAGLRPTNDVVEKEGTRRSREACAQADLILWVIDRSQAMTTEDEQLTSAFVGKPVVAVLNKCDQVARVQRDTLPIKTRAVIETSATRRAGLINLKDQVTKIALSDSAALSQHHRNPVLTNQRHIHLLEKAIDWLKQSRAAFEEGKSEEELSISIRAAIQELGQITGETVSEEILDEIFRQFCVGK